MRREEGEYLGFETREFIAPHEERGQSWPVDVPRHADEPEIWKGGQDWPVDVPISASRPVVERRTARNFWNVVPVSAPVGGRRKSSKPSGGAVKRRGRIRSLLSRLMAFVRLGSR